MIKLNLFGWLVAIVLLAGCSSNSSISSNEIKKHISYLADDNLAGRYPGTEGDRLAAEYIRNQFKKSKLELLESNGYQYFDAIAGLNYTDNNTLNVDNGKGLLHRDFIPFPYSISGAFSGAVVFAGFGLEIDSDSLSWNDYKGLDVKGKWVMMFRGDPESGSRSSRYESFSDDKVKIILAKDKGALGVIMISPSILEKEDELIPAFYDKSSASVGIPVINITRAFADKLFAEYQLTVKSVEEKMLTSKQPLHLDFKGLLNATVELEFIKIRTQNVVGMLKSENPAADGRYIVIGAHYDHLGMGGIGSGSRVPDTTAVHNGADDNASGVAGLIELAGKLSTMRKELKHNFVFVAFGGEEMGLLGSKHFADYPSIDWKSINAMINFDMIGRLNTETKAVSVSGSGTSVQSEELLKSLESSFPGLKFGYAPEGFGASDHSSFYVKDIPVFFLSTGGHPDYHTPVDDTHLINLEGEKQVIDYSVALIQKIDAMPERLTFKESGPKEATGGRRGFKVVLGIMPDFTGGSNEGLRVDYVREGGPAEKAGMLKGDLIVAIDGMQVTNIQDYMVRLKKLIPGSRIIVDVKRNGELVILTVDL